MSFDKKTWADRVSEYPARRTLTNESGASSVCTVERNEGTVTVEGDAFSAENMNDLENRIDDAISDIDDTLTNLIKLKCNCDDFMIGQTVTITDGTTTLSLEVDDTKVITFVLPNLGTWILTNPVTGATKEFEVDYYGTYETTIKSYYYYTMQIDHSKSDPAKMCSYVGDIAGHETGHDAWVNEPIFKDLAPCILVGGAVTAYLDRDNYERTVDGDSAAITTLGNDVMIEIPYRIGYRIEWIDDSILEVSITNNPNDSDYNYDAFSLNSYNDCDKIYIGAYKGYVSSSTLYSSSGKTPTGSVTETNFRTYARNKGTGYQIRGNGQLKLWQCMYLIQYCNLNSQEQVGYGYVNSSHSAATATGGANNYGFDSEIITESNPTYMTDQNHQVKCLGLEDAWGNIWEFIDGLGSDASRNIMTCQCAVNYATELTNYTNNGNGGVSANLANYMSVPQGGSNAGFTGKAVNGSTTTYYCDYANLSPSCLALFGGSWNNALYAGAFRLNLSNAFSTSDADVGARLVYLHLES